jgi:signal transduction histidine kinase
VTRPAAAGPVARPATPWAAWALAGLSIALATLWLAMAIGYHHQLGSANIIFNGDDALVAIVYPAVGALITRHDRANRIGWLMIAIGLSLGLCCVAQAYSERAPLTGPHAPSAGQWADWLGTWVWVPGWVLAITLLLLLFPDGHPPSPRWRPAIWATFASIGLMIVGAVLDPQPNSEPTYRNPTASPATAGLASVLEVGAAVLGLGAAVACLVALVIRFRRSRGEQRQQMKWFAYAGIATLVLLPGNTVLATSPLLQVMGYLDVGLLPVAVGIAILKYRLYDIDVVISKTVVYALLAALITAIYVTVVVGIGHLAGAGGQPSLGLSILATALVAAVFQPARERAQRFATHLVYGRKATPYEALAQLSERMASTYATDDLLSRMARTVGEATGALRTDVWLRSGAELRDSASFPATAEPAAAIPLASGQLPAQPATARLVPVEHDGELLGALSVSKKRGDTFSPTEENLVANLAAQAGLVLRNVALAEQLRSRLAELAASRERLITAQDRERHRLERDIRTSAQPEIAALISQLGQAAAALDGDGTRAKALLAGAAQQASLALHRLRELTRGIYPALLADLGLAAALGAQAGKVPVPVSVQAGGLGRYPQDVEAAVYFCAMEALQNVSRHAGASRASVTCSAADGELRFEVAGDGHGFDHELVSSGGLQWMADRLDAVGGDLWVDSDPGQGTRVSGRVPVTGERPRRVHTVWISQPEARRTTH